MNCSDNLYSLPTDCCNFPVIESQEEIDQEFINDYIQSVEYHSSIIHNYKLPRYERGNHKTYLRKIELSSKSQIDRIMKIYDFELRIGSDKIILQRNS